MSLSGARQLNVAHLGYAYSCAQLGDGTLMCPVGRLYTHVPSWAMVHSNVPSWAVHSSARLGNGTHMCPV